MRIAAVFPGQGSQFVGMGVDAASQFVRSRDTFARAGSVLGYDVLELVRCGPEERLRETRYSQPAIFTTNLALYFAVETELAPVVTAGHSFGEICSLTIAGALSLEAATALVDARAKAMQSAAESAAGAMSAVLGLDGGTIARVIASVNAEANGTVQLANFNAPAQIVISGNEEAVQRAGDLLLEAGAKRVVPLNVSGAWHSRLMEPAVAQFAQEVDATEFRDPEFDVISNVDAAAYRSVQEIKCNLIRSISSEVRWHDTAQALLGYGIDLVVEFGATPVLAPLMRRMPSAPAVLNVSDAQGIRKLSDALRAGALETRT